MEPVDEARARELLPRTWHAFFGRFGRLTDIQRRAIEPIVQGLPTLVGAPTAMGKTEAVLAPLSERALADGRSGGLRILVVTPTRALVNDLRRRLRGPLGQVGLSLDIKTGDSAAFDDAKPPAVLLTTPESLDSMLARRPAALRTVTAAVLDELHLLDRSVRGDQLRCLLERLDRVAASRPQRCAASATFADAPEMAARWLGAGAVSARSDGPSGGQRPIEAELRPSVTIDEAAEAIVGLYGSRPGRKLLVFANSRGQVEALAAQLAAAPSLRSRVFAHHGSLARGERLRVEKRFLAAPSAICVATMTLELGVDIGDVDGVVLVAPPPDVQSLLQRVGRGNRADAATSMLGLYAGELELRRFEHLLACAAEGRIFAEPVPFRPSVLPQQALSALLQNPKGWVSPGVLHARLPADIRPEWTLGDCEDVLAALAGSGHVRAIDGARYVADTASDRLFERGKVHSLIDDVRETEVVDATTGQAVGRVRFSRRDQEQMASGRDVTLALGGKKREVAHVRDDKVFVRSGEGLDRARFIAREAPRYSAALAADLGRFLGIPPGEMRQSGDEDDGWRLAHFLGTVWGRIFGKVLHQTGRYLRGPRAGPFFAALARPLPAPARLELGDEATLASRIDAAIAADLDGLAALLGAGAFRKLTPRDQLHRWVREAVRPEALGERLLRTRVL